MRSRRFGFSAAHVARNCSSAPLLARPSVNLRAKSLRWSKRICRPAIVAQNRCSSSSRYFGSIRCHSRWMTARRRATSGVTGTSHGTGESFAPRAALLASARGGRDARALAVEVGVEERVQRDDALVVRRRLRHEVDDDAGLLARVDAHDPADPLLVDAARRRRREVHADGRARRVPALGEQLRVHEHVDLAALVRRERLREARRRRAAGDGLGLEPGGAELLREVVGVVDAGRVHDPGRGAEAVAVEARCGLVQGLVVEGGGEGALLEVAADDRDRVDRGRGRDAHAAERRDEAAARGVAEREVVDRGGEDVRDLLRDQLLGRRHADVERLVERADRGARLLAEGGVRLVAEDEVVRLAIELRAVAGEPGVGLDRDRVVARRLLALQHGVGEAVAVALRGQVARELRDEEPTVREDEDAEPAGGLDEPCGGDRLAGSGRVPEAVATDRARVGAVDLGLGRRLLDEARRRSRRPPPRRARPRRRRRSRSVAVLVRRALGRGDELREHSGERVHLVAAKLGAGRGARWILGQHPLEAEHEPVAHLPAGRRRREPRAISSSAWSSAARRAVPGASATSGSSPACRNGSPNQASARRAAAIRSSGCPTSESEWSSLRACAQHVFRAAPSEELTLA